MPLFRIIIFFQNVGLQSQPTGNFIEGGGSKEYGISHRLNLLYEGGALELTGRLSEPEPGRLVIHKLTAADQEGSYSHHHQPAQS